MSAVDLFSSISDHWQRFGNVWIRSYIVCYRAHRECIGVSHMDLSWSPAKCTLCWLKRIENCITSARKFAADRPTHEEKRNIHQRFSIKRIVNVLTGEPQTLSVPPLIQCALRTFNRVSNFTTTTFKPVCACVSVCVFSFSVCSFRRHFSLLLLHRILFFLLKYHGKREIEIVHCRAADSRMNYMFLIQSV